MKFLNSLKTIRRGLSWATEDPRLLALGVAAYTGVTALLGWEMGQSIGYFSDSRLLRAVIWLLVMVLGGITLLHQAQWPWKCRRQQLWAGFLSTFFLYDLILALMWRGIARIFAISPGVSAWGMVVAGGISGALVWLGFENTKILRTVTHSIPLLKKPYRMVLLSDLHLGDFVGKAHAKKVVARVNEVHADLVVIAGDLFDEEAPFRDPAALSALARELASIRSRDGVVLTLGNHDPEASSPALRTFLRESGIVLLDNAIMELPEFDLAGISDPTRNPRIPLRTLLGEKKSEKPLIAVEHDPRFQEEDARAGASLVLSGHTHAGQFFPANLAVRLMLGKRRFYGYHRLGDTHLVVSAGAGVFNLPVRLGSRNEIVVLELN